MTTTTHNFCRISQSQTQDQRDSEIKMKATLMIATAIKYLWLPNCMQVTSAAV